jgi:hypothetical protein
MAPKGQVWPIAAACADGETAPIAASPGNVAIRQGLDLLRTFASAAPYFNPAVSRT